jgi:hypothetical protein
MAGVICALTESVMPCPCKSLLSLIPPQDLFESVQVYSSVENIIMWHRSNGPWYQAVKVLRLSLKLSADSEVILKTWDYRDSFLNRPPVYNKKRKDRFFRVSFGADMRKAVLSAFHEVSRDKVNSFKIKKTPITTQENQRGRYSLLLSCNTFNLFQTGFTPVLFG